MQDARDTSPPLADIRVDRWGWADLAPIGDDLVYLLACACYPLSHLVLRQAGAAGSALRAYHMCLQLAIFPKAEGQLRSAVCIFSELPAKLLDLEVSSLGTSSGGMRSSSTSRMPFDLALTWQPVSREARQMEAVG
jgi:hypothetical protein